ncbi:MAG: substrate-binding domain-containing protein, partial [Anaerolineales bacterium]|nr:substrate-binding domain-containing protein [Anaerolineales bacterium]
MLSRRLLWLSSGLMAVSLGLSACGQPTQAAPGLIAPNTTEGASASVTTAPEATALPEASTAWTVSTIASPAEISGDVITAGSSTVFPLSQRVAELYQNEGGGNITVDSIGTGAGFERFCTTGEIDIANASRPIKAGEIEACQAIGRSPIEFRVGTDA